MSILVTGAAGFIGHHLCSYLKGKGHFVRGVDVVDPEHELVADEFWKIDLRDSQASEFLFDDVDRVYALAALNGSIEYTSKVKAEIIRDNTIINLITAMNSVQSGVKRIFFSSSACVYPEFLQGSDKNPLRENLAYPSFPDSEYGWEKLYAERMYRSFMEDKGIEIRIGRFFNIYGPEGHTDPIKAKAPTAICRKVLNSKGTIEVWGKDGGAVRSFCYIDDCLRAIDLVMESDSPDPFNIGTEDHMSVDQLIDTVCEVSDKTVKRKYLSNKAQGVRNRICDYSRIEKELGWKPEVSFEEGIRRTYEWVKSQS